MNNFIVNIGNQIRFNRKLKGLSQERLAEKANISSKYLGEIERGETNLSAQILYELAIALDVSVSDFLSDMDIRSVDNASMRAQIQKYVESANADNLRKLTIFIKNFL